MPGQSESEPCQASDEKEPGNAESEPCQAGDEHEPGNAESEPCQAGDEHEPGQSESEPCQASDEQEPGNAESEPCQAGDEHEPGQSESEPCQASDDREPGNAESEPCQAGDEHEPGQSESEPCQASDEKEPGNAESEPCQAGDEHEPGQSESEPCQASDDREPCQLESEPCQASDEQEPDQPESEPCQTDEVQKPCQPECEPCQAAGDEQEPWQPESKPCQASISSVEPEQRLPIIEPEPHPLKTEPEPHPPSGINAGEKLHPGSATNMEPRNSNEETVRLLTETSPCMSKGMELEMGRDVFAEPGKIGEGEQAEVSLGKLAGSGKLCAIKTFKTFDVNMFKEIEVLTKLSSSKYVPRYYGTITDPKNPQLCAMVIEYAGDVVNMKSETLDEVLEDDFDVLEDVEWIDVALSLCKVLSDVHQTGYLHADLKIDNVMLHRDSEESLWQSKIIDFGYSKSIVAEPEPLTLTPEEKEYYGKYCKHVAPEILNCTSGSTIKSDIYSLGDTLVEIGAETGIRPIYNWGQQCMESDPADRPELKWVIDMLEKLKESCEMVLQMD